MTRDRSMHKSTSFFERVDASMEIPKEESRKTKVKQSTLFNMTKPKTTTTPASTAPAFAEEQEEDLMTQSSLQLTLQQAARKGEASIRMEETQQTQDESQESQFDSLPIDVTV